MQAAISAALAEAELYKPEKRPFWPHLTLARVRGGGGRRGAPPAMPPFETEPAPASKLGGERVTLYRSHLSPGGARYERLASRRLRGEA